MHFRELFKMSVLQTDCRSLFTLNREQLCCFRESVLDQFLSAAVNISGSLLTSPLSVLFTNRRGQNPRKEFWQKCRTHVPGKTTASPSLISTQRTVLPQRHRWVSAISADLRAMV